MYLFKITDISTGLPALMSVIRAFLPEKSILCFKILEALITCGPVKIYAQIYLQAPAE